MRRIAVAIVVALLALTVAGCGTAEETAGGDASGHRRVRSSFCAGGARGPGVSERPLGQR